MVVNVWKIYFYFYVSTARLAVSVGMDVQIIGGYLSVLKWCDRAPLIRLHLCVCVSVPSSQPQPTAGSPPPPPSQSTTTRRPKHISVFRFKTPKKYPFSNLYFYKKCLFWIVLTTQVLMWMRMGLLLSYRSYFQGICPK